ncbi:hypothetical protein L7F22_052297 [Adiantum nelumboides]|nr:hypothetical protein [Adiantum nelumboides]
MPCKQLPKSRVTRASPATNIQDTASIEAQTPPTPKINPMIVLNQLPLDVAPIEDFGREKDLKTLLKTVQPPPFLATGKDVATKLEEWIIQMDDYFALARYNSIAQGIMGRAKLRGPAKTWWKLNCQTRNVAEVTQSWDELKFHLKERYLPLDYSTTRMNEFFACKLGSETIDTYYDDFSQLSKYAPLMTGEQKLSRFILGLGDDLALEVEALRPVSLADVLIQAKLKYKSLFKRDSAINRKREAFSYPSQPFRVPKLPHIQRPFVQPPPPPQLIRVNALPVTQSGRQIQCYECGEFGHKKAEFPKGNKRGHSKILEQEEGSRHKQEIHLSIRITLDKPTFNPARAATVNFVQ